ncbi:glycosyltransferase [Candidatus Dependentiae bacterium]
MQKKRLNIAIVTNNYTPYSGGVVSSIDSLVKQLHSLGHKAFIITLDFLGEQHHDPYYVIRIPSKFRFMYKENHMAIPIHMTNKLEKIITLLNPDIIHMQHPFYICKSALNIAKKRNIPTVFTYHTIYEQYLHYVPTPQFLSRPIVKKIALSFCKKVNGIIAPSNYIHNYLINHNITTNIATIPSGVLPVFIKNQLWKKDTDVFRLLTVSRFVKEKNITFLLKLFKKLYVQNQSSASEMQSIQAKRKNRFIFTLGGYGYEYENLKKYAYKKLKLSPEMVRFEHMPRKKDIADLYCKSDLFLFSSTSDTQGLVLAEAMGCGCPVLALDGPGQRDIIQNGHNGFLCESETDMINKILLIENDRTLQEKLQQGALATSKQYHPTTMVHKIVKIYRELL